MWKMLIKIVLLERNVWKSSAKIRRLQDRKLRKLLHRAWNHSAYYRQRMTAAGIQEAQLDTVPLSTLPIITKHELLEHFDELTTDPRLTQKTLREFDQSAKDQACLFDRYHVVHSSGSSESPGYFIYDEAAWQTMLAGILRGALWGMTLRQRIQLLRRKPRILYIAATDGRYGGAMAVSAGIQGIQAEPLLLDIKLPLSDWVNKICSFQPSIVVGYPSALKILAGLVDQGQVKLNLQRVLSCGEPLNGSLRSYLESRLDAEIINLYGASESLALGVECRAEEGMILFDDLNIIEVVHGRVVLTCLYNTVQPLIRYELDDQLTLKESRKGFSRAAIEVCRSEDLMWFAQPDGQFDFLHPLALEGFCIKGLHDLQFVQQDAGHFEVLCESGPDDDQVRITADLSDQLHQLLKAKQLTTVSFKIRFVNRIKPDPITGKKKLILRKAEAV